MNAPTHDARRQLVWKLRLDAGLWLVLVMLVGASLLVAFHVPREYAFAADVVIAIVQVAVLLLFFMQLREARALILLTSVAGAIFVAIMFVLTFNDLFSRV